MSNTSPSGPNHPRVYSQGDVLALSRINKFRFERWGRLKLINPTHGGGDGRGSHREFSLFDIFVIAVLNRLADTGMVKTEVLLWVRMSLGQLEYVSGFPIRAEDRHLPHNSQPIRWKAFQQRSRKDEGLALLLVRIVEDKAFAEFVDDPQQISTEVSLGGIGSVWVMVEIGRLAAELESETGDRVWL